MLVKAWITVDIDILHRWGNFKHNIGLGGSIKQVLGLFGLVQGVWEEMDRTTRITKYGAWVIGGNLMEREGIFSHDDCTQVTCKLVCRKEMS